MQVGTQPGIHPGIHPGEKIRNWMTDSGCDAVLLRTRANFAWVTGGRDNHIVSSSEIGVADLIVFADRVVCVTNQIERRRIAEEELLRFPHEMVEYDWTAGADGAIAKLLSGHRAAADVDGVRLGSASTGSTHLGIELGPMGGGSVGGASAGSASAGSRSPAVTYLPNISEALMQLRRTLNEDQIRQYRELCSIASAALESIAFEIRPGQTEHEIAARMMAEVARQGCQPIVSLVATDERLYRYRHPIPTTKALERHAMMVVCAEKYGLVANVTRFVHFGPLPADLEENQRKCAYIDVRMNCATRPGVCVGDVFRCAIDAYKEVGFPDDWKWLHQGGPTGYASREYLATPDSTDVIRAGQAYAWNPALRGVKSEDTMLVTEAGNEFLTATGNWPTVRVEWDGAVYDRPAVLVR